MSTGSGWSDIRRNHVNDVCRSEMRRETARGLVLACASPTRRCTTPSLAEATLLDYGVIADVSATLEQVLTDALAPLGSVAEVHDLQGIIPVMPARLTLFLFEVSEDASARNRPRVREIAPGPPPRLTVRKPPMALLLRYLLTPWSGDRLTDHRILGRAMQVLYDNAILSGPALVGGLAGTDQALKISVASLTVEERARVWYSVQKPYRVSVAYEARVVNLVSETAGEVSTVTDRSLGYMISEVAR